MPVNTTAPILRSRPATSPEHLRDPVGFLRAGAANQHHVPVAPQISVTMKIYAQTSSRATRSALKRWGDSSVGDLLLYFAAARGSNAPHEDHWIEPLSWGGPHASACEPHCTGRGARDLGPSGRYSTPGGGWVSMNSTTIITGLTPLQATELICIVYCAHHLHVPGATHRRSRATTIPPTASTGHRCLAAYEVSILRRQVVRDRDSVIGSHHGINRWC